MPILRVTCPICSRDHNKFIPWNSAIRIVDLPCDERCHTILMDRVYGGPPTRKCQRCGNTNAGHHENGIEYCSACGGEKLKATDPASTPAPTIANRGLICKNYNCNGGTCRVGVRADRNAHRAFEMGVVLGNPCPLDGIADRHCCPEYK